MNEWTGKDEINMIGEKTMHQNCLVFYCVLQILPVIKNIFKEPCPKPTYAERTEREKEAVWCIKCVTVRLWSVTELQF